MTEFILQHRGVYLRVDHATVGACIAAKHALRTDRNSGEQWVKVVGKEVGRL